MVIKSTFMSTSGKKDYLCGHVKVQRDLVKLGVSFNLNGCFHFNFYDAGHIHIFPTLAEQYVKPKVLKSNRFQVLNGKERFGAGFIWGRTYRYSIDIPMILSLLPRIPTSSSEEPRKEAQQSKEISIKKENIIFLKEIL